MFGVLEDSKEFVPERCGLDSDRVGHFLFVFFVGALGVRPGLSLVSFWAPGTLKPGQPGNRSHSARLRRMITNDPQSDPLPRHVVLVKACGFLKRGRLGNTVPAH